MKTGDRASGNAATRRAILFAAAAAPIVTRVAAEEAATRRIFFVAGAAGARSNPNIATFEDELRRLGYTDGRNIAIDYLLRSVD